MRKLIRMLVLAARIVGLPGGIAAWFAVWTAVDVFVIGFSGSTSAIPQGIGSVIQITCMGMVMLLTLQASIRLHQEGQRRRVRFNHEVEQANCHLIAQRIAIQERLNVDRAKIQGLINQLNRLRGENDGEGWKRGEKQ